MASMLVEESVQIARPCEDVWAFVADPANDPLWCSKVKSVELVEPGVWKVIHKPVPLRPPIELSLEHLELDAPSRLRLREEDEASVFEVEYRLESIPTGTRFTQISTIEWKKLPGPLQRIFARGVRRDVRNQLDALERVLDGT